MLETAKELHKLVQEVATQQAVWQYIFTAISLDTLVMETDEAAAKPETGGAAIKRKVEDRNAETPEKNKKKKKLTDDGPLITPPKVEEKKRATVQQCRAAKFGKPPENTEQMLMHSGKRPHSASKDADELDDGLVAEAASDDSLDKARACQGKSGNIWKHKETETGGKTGLIFVNYPLQNGWPQGCCKLNRIYVNKRQ